MDEATPHRRYLAVTWQQELLLKAVLSEGPVSLAAWKQWRAHVDPETLDYDSQRLLPLLYSALQRQGISDPQMGRFKGVYRRTWYDNTLRFHAAGAILRTLRDAGIATMLVDGAALTPQYYRDLGLRPMDAFDIVVSAPRGPAATDTLKTIGWAPVEPAGITEGEATAVRQGCRFRNAHCHEVDLHWRVFNRHPTPATDSKLWATARPSTLAGVPTHVLSPSDQLLHVCEREMKRRWWGGENAPNPCWVADAVMILRNAPEALDWNRLSARAQQLRLVLPLREALSYLHDLLDVPVPASALARISTMSVPLAERVAEHARTRPPKRWGPWVALGVRYLEYSATLPPDTGRFRRLVGAPAFFRRRWGSVSLWQLPFAAFFRGLRRIRWAAEEHRTRRAGMSTQNTRP